MKFLSIRLVRLYIKLILIIVIVEVDINAFIKIDYSSIYERHKKHWHWRKSPDILTKIRLSFPMFNGADLSEWIQTASAKY
jgi:hypothetical protein